MSLADSARILFLLVLVVTATVADVRTRRIPNLVTLPSIVVGLALWAAFDSARAFLAVLLLVAGVLAVGFILFALGVFGGGDGKLLAGVAALGGTMFFGEVFIWMALFGGVVALGLLAWKRALIPFLRRLFQAGYQLLLFRLVPGEVIEGEGHRIPYAVIVAGGVVLALIARWKGFELVPRLTG